MSTAVFRRPAPACRVAVRSVAVNVQLRCQVRPVSSRKSACTTCSPTATGTVAFTSTPWSACWGLMVGEATSAPSRVRCASTIVASDQPWACSSVEPAATTLPGTGVRVCTYGSVAAAATPVGAATSVEPAAVSRTSSHASGRRRLSASRAFNGAVTDLPGGHGRKGRYASRVRVRRRDRGPGPTPRGTPQAGDELATSVSACRGRPTTVVSSGAELQRLRNLAANPDASVLVDHYEDDWSQLWWARADGVARIIRNDPERSRKLAPLRDKYPPYRDIPPAGPVVAIAVTNWSTWTG